MKRGILYLGLAGLALFVALSCLFVVDQTENAVVQRFGQPRRTLLQPGLYIKWPFPAETATRFDNRLRILNPSPAEYLTRDKKNLVADSYLIWQIEDPLRFLLAAGGVQVAEARLSDLLAAKLGSALGAADFSSLVTADASGRRLNELQQMLREQCQQQAAMDFGIRVADVRLKRLSFPEQNMESVFNRMRAERGRIATAYRSEGEEEAAKIRAQADREAREILAQAYQEAETVKGEGDAAAARTYAEAFSKDPEFYKFWRTLQAYEQIFGAQTTLVLSANSELFRLLQGKEAASAPH